MKGDFTRSTFDPDRHYNGVRLQQGRVLLDSDFNEQVDIQAYLSQTETIDVIGPCGAPQGNAGFEIGVTEDALDLTISPGRIYVDGILCELMAISTAIEDFIDATTILVSAIQVDGHRFEADQWVVIEGFGAAPQIAQISDVSAEAREITLAESIDPIGAEAQPTVRILALYSAQPDYPDPDPETLAAGIYLAYLDVWQRHITALEDPTIREVALGGPDTTTRTKTIWQVKLFRAGDLEDDTLNCLSDLEAWQDAIAPSSGQMLARAEPEIDETEPCLVPAQAGYRGLENQLYRVEVHNVNSETEITIKWSRENGSVVTAWEGQDELQPEKLTISSPGRDAVLGFGPDQWIELTDDVRELKGLPGTLVKVAQVDGSVLTIDTDTIDFDDDFSPEHNPKIRRWDMPGESAGEITVDLTDDETWIALENGIEVKFEAGRYHTGDYWLIPARTATGDIEWPRDADTGEALAQLPQGIKHHYCRLALLSHSGDTWSGRIEDCRPLFPPLTELTRFFIIGGDGQEAMPGNPLPQRLQVGVMNGEQPVAGRTVRFTANAGGLVAEMVADLPAATNTLETITDEAGVAGCVWQLQNDPTTPSQVVTAELLDAAGNPTDHPPLTFNANLSIARQVAYEPGECEDLAGATTVQQALDILCNLERGGVSCAITVGEGGQFTSLAEAIKALLDEGSEHICICLLPGDHDLPEAVEFSNEATGIRAVEITGCGVESRVILNETLTAIGVETFALKNLSLEVRNVNQVEAALTFELYREVTIRDCHLVSDITEQPVWSLLRFADVDPEQLNRIHLANNLIRHPFNIETGGLAMHVRTPFTDAILENNRIDGAIAFLGDKSIGAVLDRNAAQIIAGTIEELGGTLPASQNSLHIRNNHISQVAATDFLASLNADSIVYQNAFVTDNHFGGIQNTFVAQHIALTTNVFTAADPVGMAAGATATYIGNRGPNPNAQLWDLAAQSTEGLNLLLAVIDL